MKIAGGGVLRLSAPHGITLVPLTTISSRTISTTITSSSSDRQSAHARAPACVSSPVCQPALRANVQNMRVVRPATSASHARALNICYGFRVRAAHIRRQNAIMGT